MCVKSREDRGVAGYTYKPCVAACTHLCVCTQTCIEAAAKVHKTSTNSVFGGLAELVVAGKPHDEDGIKKRSDTILPFAIVV